MKMFDNINNIFSSDINRKDIIIFIAAIIPLSIIIDYGLDLRSQIFNFLDTTRTISQLIISSKNKLIKYNGVYKKLTDFEKPNFYIKLHDREITTIDGEKYTMISPFDFGSIHNYSSNERNGIIIRTISLYPINPENIPNEFERNAILNFQNQKNYFSYTIDNFNTLMVFFPYIFDETCAKCHEKRKYNEEKMKGGISFSIEIDLMKPFSSTNIIVILASFGAIFFYLFSKKYSSNAAQNINVSRDNIFDESSSVYKCNKIEILQQFSGAAAHDFNNILASIMTFSYLLQEGSNTDEEHAEYIQYVNLSCKFGRYLTANLLTFGNRQSINLQKISLNAVVKNLTDILNCIVSKGLIEFIFELDNSEKTISADSGQIEQTIINLCLNARDAMPDGGTLRILTKNIYINSILETKFSSIPQGDYMLLAVNDTGRGINDNDLSNIFDPLYSTKASKMGIGLGLAVVELIAKRHNAYVNVESTPNAGTTFSLYFAATN